MTKRLIVIIIAFFIVIGAGYGVIQYLGGRPSETPIIETPVGEQGIITIEGEIVCLPGKSGHYSLECAIGLLGENGNYYGLKNLNQQDLIDGKYPSGTRVKISGNFSKKEDKTNKYDILGTIDVKQIAKDKQIKPSLTITSPKEGEILKIGETYTISWSSINASTDSWVSLHLRSSGYLIQDNLPSSGSFSWTVPKNVIVRGESDIDLLIQTKNNNVVGLVKKYADEIFWLLNKSRPVLAKL